MPGYKNGGVCTFTITNQEAVLYAGQHGAVELKLPHRKERQVLKGPCWGGRLKEVCVKPCHGRYLLRIVLETEDVHMPSPGKESAGIDFGVDNIAAIACTDGSAVLYRGGAILSGNRKYIKLRAEYAGILAKGRARPCASSRRLTDMAYHHANFNADQVHKISADIVRWCVAHHAGTLVLGTNRGWKTACRMGSRNNRDFVSMPSGRLQAAVARKAERAGITVIEQEESYTSKADLTAGDYMPVYGADDNRAVFSGKRIHRGLYRTRDGLLVNADCMAAGNILRKAVPDAWEGRTDFRFLCGPETRGFRDLNPSAGTGNMAQGT
jgi:putative transposase